MENNRDNNLRRLQMIEKEILDEIVRICESHNLSYYLIGGTLLGAVRHKGFIPWDDDLDIVMPRADYNKFCSLCISGDLNSNYYLHCIDTDPEYWLRFAKIRKKNTIFNEKNIAHLDVPKGIYVDIFPLDETQSLNSTIKRIRILLVQFLSIAIYRKKGLKFHYKKYVEIALRLISCFSIKKLTDLQIKLMVCENRKSRKFYVNFGSNYHAIKQTMPKEVYEPAGEIEFEGTIYKCPRDYEYVLSRIYGSDYMELPPVEKRVTHSPVNISFDMKQNNE